ncbi:MAG: hypothetical protein IKM55_01865 [Bacilli bacterium]|nr:hypothetical protein [Bacillota bacterium]MBR6820952.1 hypothetical protein [Bacilli bacterium]
MAIIEILKQGEVDGSDIKYKKNAAKPKIKSADKEVSLNSLNKKKTSSFDFSKNDNPEMAYGKLKTERGIVGIILSTLFMVLLLGGGLIGIIFGLLKIFDMKIVLFQKKNFYSVQIFNSEFGIFLLTLLALLIIVSIVFVIIINLSVKVRFRKSYLSKTNVYVYDTFLVVLNILIFSIIGLVFFLITDGYYKEFSSWISEGLLPLGVKLDIMNLFKYVIVIISAIFMSLNSFRGIAITHKKNEFIFRNHL